VALAGRGASDEASGRHDAAEELAAAAASGVVARLAGEKPVPAGGKAGEVWEEPLGVEALRGFERVRKGGTGRFRHP
jgi:hypothetical protein